MSSSVATDSTSYLTDTTRRRTTSVGLLKSQRRTAMEELHRPADGFRNVVVDALNTNHDDGSNKSLLPCLQPMTANCSHTHSHHNGGLATKSEARKLARSSSAKPRGGLGGLGVGGALYPNNNSTAFASSPSLSNSLNGFHEGDSALNEDSNRGGAGGRGPYNRDTNITSSLSNENSQQNESNAAGTSSSSSSHRRLPQQPTPTSLLSSLFSDLPFLSNVSAVSSSMVKEGFSLYQQQRSNSVGRGAVDFASDKTLNANASGAPLPPPTLPPPTPAQIINTVRSNTALYESAKQPKGINDNNNTTINDHHSNTHLSSIASLPTVQSLRGARLPPPREIVGGGGVQRYDPTATVAAMVMLNNGSARCAAKVVAPPPPRFVRSSYGLTAAADGSDCEEVQQQDEASSPPAAPSSPSSPFLSPLEAQAAEVGLLGVPITSGMLDSKGMIDLMSPEVIKLKKRPKPVGYSIYGAHTYTYDDLPEHLKDNPFILNHYRLYLTTEESFRSVFELHNETGNIWTHIIGFCIFVALGVWMLGYYLPFSGLGASATHYIVFGLMAVGFAGCMACSAIFHAMASHMDLPTYHMMHALDYLGISLLIVGSFIPILYYGFVCQPQLQWGYMAMTGVLGSAGIVAPLLPFFEEPSFYWARFCIYTSITASAVIPVGHIYLGMPVNHTNMPMLEGICLTFLLYSIAAAVYCTKFPERFAPGKFDLYFHSHQLWHSCIIFAGISHFFTCIALFQNWSVMKGNC